MMYSFPFNHHSVHLQILFYFANLRSPTMSTTNEPIIQMPEPTSIAEPVPQPAPTPLPDAHLSVQPDQTVDFANPDTTDTGASVQRHGTWSKGAGASGPRVRSECTASLNERASIASNALDDETRGRIAKAESETFP